MILRMGSKNASDTSVQNGPYFFNWRKTSSFCLVNADHLKRVRRTTGGVGRRRHLGRGGGGREESAAAVAEARVEEGGSGDVTVPVVVPAISNL